VPIRAAWSSSASKVSIASRAVDYQPKRHGNGADAGRRRQPARTQPRQPGTERAGAAGHLLHLAAHCGAGDVERLQSARRRLRRVADALQRFLPGRTDIDELGLDLAAVGQRQADGERLVGHGNPKLSPARPSASC
jgi:hypothetical protein